MPPYRESNNLLLRELVDQLYRVVGILRSLNLLYHHLHVNAEGPPYYGDHLLLQRLYEGEDSGEEAGTSPIDEIDAVMERIAGLTGGEPVSLGLVLEHMNLYLKGTENGSLWQAQRLEYKLQDQLESISSFLEGQRVLGPMKDGVLNLLQGVADAHQTNIYLLEKRLRGEKERRANEQVGWFWT